MLCSLFFASLFCFQQPNFIHYEKATFTAYTLSENETDYSPEIGAGNHNLKILSKTTRVCATRKLPLHTKINIKGIGLCEILDRTSLKYADRIDILMPTQKEAFAFGKNELEYYVIK
jgi:3D (Asp-Asp-Asp) domain-containing protein